MRVTVFNTFISLRFIIHDMHFFEIRDIEFTHRFRAPEICIHFFERHNTTIGSSCQLQPNTCDIHLKVFYSKNIRWGSTECSPSSQQPRWLHTISERQRDSLAFNQIKMEDRRCIAGVDLSQSLTGDPCLQQWKDETSGSSAHDSSQQFDLADGTT